MIAGRLWPIASRIISHQQYAFVKGKHNSNCIMSTSECMNVLDTRAYASNTAIKFDIRKAYDTLEWLFLLQVLKDFGFCDIHIGWIHNILPSTRLSIKINGSAHGFSHCDRGVKQGDPLSPLLFCIVENVLSRGIGAFIQECRLIHISALSGAAALSYIFYADDNNFL